MGEQVEPAGVLQAELSRWPWGAAAWAAIGEESRVAYGEWVLAAPTPGRAQRRASTVAKRLWTGRRYGGPVRRRLQALLDLLDAPGGAAATPTDLTPPGWLP